MKKSILFIMLTAFAAVSCEKTGSDPEDDRIIEFQDQAFLEALLTVKQIPYYPDGSEEPVNATMDVDKNNDGQISEKEAAEADILDVSGAGITNMDEIRYFSSLYILHCYDNDIRSLDLSGCHELTGLYCNDNSLTSLNLEGCSKLQSANCRNNSLTEINLGGCSSLRALYLTQNQLASIDISDCRNSLTYLNFEMNEITSIELGNCPALQQLLCYDNKLTSLDISGCPELWNILCYDNPLTSVTLTQAQYDALHDRFTFAEPDPEFNITD